MLSAIRQRKQILYRSAVGGARQSLGRSHGQSFVFGIALRRSAEKKSLLQAKVRTPMI